MPHAIDGDCDGDSSTSQLVQLAATSSRNKTHLIPKNCGLITSRPGVCPHHIHFDGNDVEIEQPPYAVRIAPSGDMSIDSCYARLPHYEKTHAPPCSALSLGRQACTVVEFTLRCMSRSYLSRGGMHSAYHGSRLPSTATLSAASRIAHLPGPATRCHSCRLADASHLRRNYFAFEASCLRRMNGLVTPVVDVSGLLQFPSANYHGTLPSLAPARLPARKLRARSRPLHPRVPVFYGHSWLCCKPSFSP